MAERRILVQVKKNINRVDSGKIWYRTSWTWDFTCPTLWKFKTLGQVGCGTCDKGPYKWLYRRL